MSLTASLCHSFIISGLWESSFDRSVVLQGQKMARSNRGRPLGMECFEDGSLALSAMILDRSGSEFDVECSLWEGADGLEVEGTCSCDFANQCSHAAAVFHLFALPSQLEKVGKILGDGPREDDLKKWVDSLKRCEPFRHVGSPKSQIVYLLECLREGLVVRVRSVGLFTDGRLKETVSQPVMEIGAGFSQAFTPVDRAICRQLLGSTGEGAGTWRLSGDGMDGILREIIATGRCFWRSPQSAPFSWGEKRSGVLGWTTEEGGRRPELVVEPESEHFLPCSPLLYLDKKRGQVGEVSLNETEETARAWIAGPVVPDESINVLADLMPQAFPLPTETEEVTAATEELVIEMHVGEARFTSPAVLSFLKIGDPAVLSARVVARYGKHAFSLMQRSTTVERVGSDAVMRDAEEEGRALKILQFLGLTTPLLAAADYGVDLGQLTDEEKNVWVSTLDQFSPAQYWSSFRARRADELIARGWQITYDLPTELAPLAVSEEAIEIGLDPNNYGWFALSAGFLVEGKQFDLQPILADLLEMGALEAESEVLAAETFFYYPKDSNEVLQLPSQRMRRILGVLKGLLLEFSGGKKIEVPVTEAAILIGEAPEIDAPESVKALSKRMKKASKHRDTESPAGLQATLRSYQEDGFQWMQFLARHGLHGILADDMGLGKTLQCIAHVLAELESGRSRGAPSLVLAPTSVVNNWKAEAAKWAPSLKVLVLQGSGRKRLYRHMANYDLVVTSYALLARDIDQLVEHEFHIAALDEAQHIKTPTAQVTQAACRLRARHRLCLSGTPIENHLGELWSLMAFLMPGLLGKHDDFTSTYRTPIEKNGDEEVQQRLVRRVGSLIMRRTKDQVAKELPPKTEVLHNIELTPGQKDLYETVRAVMDKRVRDAIAAAGLESSQIVFLDALMKLRQICCHPQLLAKKEAQKVTESAKMDYLVGLLDTLVAEKRKVLIFSQFTSMLDLIEAHLVSRRFTYLKLTGSSKSETRQEMVNIFQRGETDIFLISLKAGGTGLTLTAADNVIHFDPWWNPAAENQATDRAYRIGQDKPVFVHKLICQNTVEQRIQELQTSKSNLADALLSGSVEKLSLDEDTINRLLAPGESE